jgi:alginate lyase
MKGPLISPSYRARLLLIGTLSAKTFCGIMPASAQVPPHTLLFNRDNLLEVKKRIQADDVSITAPLGRLKRDADRALAAGPFSVTHKNLLPPSGDKHDYLSIAPYWWPNPNTPNGLPYIRRDGEVNPERDQSSDRGRLDNMVQGVKTLALSYYFTGRDDHAAHAAKLLRAWFLDQATKMNPELKYAQAVPGRNSGRAAGIIETHGLPELIDAAVLLNGSKSWSELDHKHLQSWFNSYLSWLLESTEGKAEAKAENNHGIWYDVQVAALAIFVGHDESAKKVLTEFPAKRIAQQIEPDGRQPRELARTQAWNYSIFNLEALFNAASIADKVGIDLWNYRTTDRRSIRQALDWLIPFATGERKWSYKQISMFEPVKLAPLIRRAANQYHDPAYEQAIIKLGKNTADERWQLLYPRMRE